MTEWEKRRKEFTEKYYHNDHEAMIELLELGDRIDTELTVTIERNWDKKRKLDAIMNVFRSQPARVIQWVRYSDQYCWGLIGPSDGERMVKKILDILMDEVK